jgi:hypothetical protein
MLDKNKGKNKYNKKMTKMKSTKETDMVATEVTSKRNLQGYELFAAAATCLFQSWPIFYFSKTHQTGGDNTSEKISRIIEDALYNFEERWSLAVSSMSSGGGRDPKSRVFVDEMAPFLYEVLESDLNLQLEDSSPEVVSGHLIRMFDQCLEGDETEARKSLKKEEERIKKEKERRERRGGYHVVGRSVAEEEESVSVANHNEAVVKPKSWSPFTSPIMCFDIHTHNTGERSHGNSTTSSTKGFGKSVKNATKHGEKPSKTKSSWNKGGKQ